MQYTEYLSKGVKKPSQRVRWTGWGILPLQDEALFIFVFICSYMGHSPCVKNGKFSSIFFFLQCIAIFREHYSPFSTTATLRTTLTGGAEPPPMQCQSVKKSQLLLQHYRNYLCPDTNHLHETLLCFSAINNFVHI